MKTLHLGLIVLCISLSFCSYGQIVKEYMDLQTHPCMHIPYGFFGKGMKYFDPERPPKLSFKHQFTNVNYANFLQNNEGVRVVVVGALTNEFILSKKKARRMILEEINYINEFSEARNEYFVVAHSPQEVREYLTTTDKTIIIHSIEGAKKLINSFEDALFWAEQGVAYITLIHLSDYKLGGAAIKPGAFPALINLKGTLKKLFKPHSERGLTKEGENVIRWLADAGIMTDISHMCPETRKDALLFMKKNDIPPISTHDPFKPIQNHPRGLDYDDVLNIYKQNGFISLPVSGESLKPFHPEEPYKSILDTLNCFCDGSIDAYRFTYEALKEFVHSHIHQIDTSSIAFNKYEQMTVKQKVNFSIGFQTDFNGWLNHSSPRYGKDGCFDLPADVGLIEDIELYGLAHPGLLPSQWKYLEKNKVDLEPIKLASEKFLQLWELFLDRKEQKRQTP